MDNLKKYTDAAKLDILNLIEKDEPHVFEFRRAAEICQFASMLCGYDGTPDEHIGVSLVIRAAEDKAPMLYDALMGRAFNGEALLREKYEEIRAHHTQLRRKALDIAEAQEKLLQDKASARGREEALRAYERSLERERERLQLEADSRGVALDLPELPQLPSKGDEETDEEASQDDGRAYNSADRYGEKGNY